LLLFAALVRHRPPKRADIVVDCNLFAIKYRTDNELLSAVLWVPVYAAHIEDLEAILAASNARLWP
jgi:hypothetical protein